MNKIFKVFSIIVVIACILCACGAKAGNSGPAIALTDDEKALIEAFGTDLNVVAPADFAKTVSSFEGTNVGSVYQLVGRYHVVEGEEYPTLSDDSGKTTISLRYVVKEMTDGDTYSVTGIVAEDTHDDHAHLVFDVVAVETYTAK